MTLQDSSRPGLLIVGGHSKAAVAFRRLATETGRFNTFVLVRRPGEVFAGEVEHVVENYFAPSQAVFAGMACVVNFTGAASLPSAEALRRLNTDGPVQLAAAAKASGLRRFIQLSSLSIFGGAEDMGLDTPPNPTSLYGETKLAAETGLVALADSGFSVVAVRAPLIYGPDGGGKLSVLVRVLRRLPAFPAPKVLQERSMVHVRNLALGLMVLVSKESSGPAFITDPIPFRLDRLVGVMCSTGDRRIRLIGLPSMVFRLLRRAAPRVYESLYQRSLVRAEDSVPLPPQALPLEQSLLDVL
jgi:nucleoside-diphosphate-sugar epimerase